MTKNVWSDEMGVGGRRSQMPRATEWLVAVQAQWRLLSRGKRRDIAMFLVVAAAMLVIAALNVKIPVIHGRDMENGGVAMRFEMFAEGDFGLISAPGLLAVVVSFAVLMICGLVWALSVWGREGPSGRAYHWAMPIARWAHDLARVVAGAVWLLAGVIAMWIAVALGLVMAGRVATLGQVSMLGWANYAVAPLTVYLWVSVAGVCCDRAGRAVMWAYVAIIGPYLLFGWIDFAPGYRVFYEIAGGEFGYPAALTGAFFGGLVPGFNSGQGVPWVWPALLWLGMGIVGVVAGARRHREPGA
jgi:hypothetical protein